MEQYRIKPLLRKMGYKTFLEESVREKWTLPLARDLKGREMPAGYDFVWVLDKVSASHYTEEDKKYGVQLAYLFDVKNQKKIIVNVKFIEKCVILKEV